MPDMSDTILSSRKCVPCEGGTPPMPHEDALRLLPQAPEWAMADDGRSISRKFTFKTYRAAQAFVNKVADVAEAEGHHPDIAWSWNRVTFTLTTHAAKGLTENDFIMAAKIDKISA